MEFLHFADTGVFLSPRLGFCIQKNDVYKFVCASRCRIFDGVLVLLVKGKIKKDISHNNFRGCFLDKKISGWTSKTNKQTINMEKTRNAGGQRRTITASCGWITSGSVVDVDARYKLHLKKCKPCAELALTRKTGSKLPQFDLMGNGRANGGKGGVSDGRVVTEKNTVVVSGNSLQEVTCTVREMNSFQGGEREVIESKIAAAAEVVKQ
jgi:hypothetical protein